MSLSDRFAEAQVRVKGLQKTPTPDVLLELYGLFKQATLGDAGGERPGAFDFKGRAKWDAWAARRGMATDAAMEAYVALVERLVGGPPEGWIQLASAHPPSARRGPGGD